MDGGLYADVTEHSPRTLAPPEATITDIYAVVIRVSVESLGLRLVFRVRWGYYS